MRTFDKTITRGILFNLLPFRTSIEIECFGSVLINKSLADGVCYDKKTLMDIYGLKDYDENVNSDCCISSIEKISERELSIPSFCNLLSNKEHFLQIIEILKNPLKYKHLDIIKKQDSSSRRYTLEKLHPPRFDWEERFVQNEHRISISNYSQLLGLYKVLEDMKKYCIENPGSGIHVHVDATTLFGHILKERSLRYKIEDNIRNRLNEVERIFGPYTGDYNRKDISSMEHTWVRWNCFEENYNRYTHTLEFRIAPMTFDYERIVTWMVQCNSFVKSLYNLAGVKYYSSNRVRTKREKSIDSSCNVTGNIVDQTVENNPKMGL